MCETCITEKYVSGLNEENCLYEKSFVTDLFEKENHARKNLKH